MPMFIITTTHHIDLPGIMSTAQAAERFQRKHPRLDPDEIHVRRLPDPVPTVLDQALTPSPGRLSTERPDRQRFPRPVELAKTYGA